MSWLYRLFKRNVANTRITLDTSVTSGMTLPALTVTGTTTQTGVETFTAAPVVTGTATSYTATDPSYITATIGGIDIVIAAIHTMTAACIPAHIGDILINQTTGKMYVAAAIAASTDWKIVTSA